MPGRKAAGDLRRLPLDYSKKCWRQSDTNSQELLSETIPMTLSENLWEAF